MPHFAGLAAMPPEILQEIFSYYVWSQPNILEVSPVIIIGSVCRRWNEVVTDAPSLWQRCDLQTKHTATWQKRLDESFRRTKGLPLSIGMILYPSQYWAGLKALTRHATQVFEIRLEIFTNTVVSIPIDMTLTEFPGLKYFSIHDKNHAWLHPIGLFTGFRFPTITTLDLCCGHFLGGTIALETTYHHLRELCVDAIQPQQTSSLLDRLEEFKVLELLDLEITFYPFLHSAPPPKVIVLDSLKSLTIRLSHIPRQEVSPRAIFNRIHAPQIQHIGLVRFHFAVCASIWYWVAKQGSVLLSLNLEMMAAPHKFVRFMRFAPETAKVSLENLRQLRIVGNRRDYEDDFPSTAGQLREQFAHICPGVEEFVFIHEGSWEDEPHEKSAYAFGILFGLYLLYTVVNVIL
ncbi:hypothetical protein DL96DRAFT_1610836 [Flagelloscypha sp. PMI_526]|nr:hypothetical protein DL96DRAFT_1610836 [Flagelloscypha sp. PMI_526]